jgi:DNA-directed RNA polymerase specialized sigma24 family protein
MAELIEPDTSDEALDRLNCDARVRNALCRMPALYRQTLIDRFVRGHSVKRISHLKRVPVGTVLSRIFTAKRLLRKAWEA